jgi:outer membrane protein assembly factor BamB
VTQSTSTPRKRPTLLYVVGGLNLLVICGWLLYPQFEERFQGQYVSDAGLLDKLSTEELVAPPASTEVGWPQWRGPNRNGVSAETGLLVTWPQAGPPVLWTAKTGEGQSAPVIARGKVLLQVQDGDHEAVICWNEDGAEQWRFRYPGRFAQKDAGVGPHASPTIADELVYVVSAQGTFHCVSLTDGKPVWSHDLLREFSAGNQEYGTAFSALVEGDLVVTVPGGTDGKCFAAFNRRDGKLVWTAENGPADYSSPVAATVAGQRQIVALTGTAVMGLSPLDGHLLWKFAWQPGWGCNVATPLVVGDYVFVSTGYGKGCALLHVAADASGVLKARAVYEHNRYRNHFSTSVLVGEHLYGFDETYLACMEFRTGKVRWKKRGFGKGSLTAAAGHLIVLGDDGLLAIAEANPERYVEKSSCKLLEGRCWTMPVLANGRLYIRNEQQMLCLNLRAGGKAD